jgi:hypothetical protein
VWYRELRRSKLETKAKCKVRKAFIWRPRELLRKYVLVGSGDCTKRCLPSTVWQVVALLSLMCPASLLCLLLVAEEQC